MVGQLVPPVVCLIPAKEIEAMHRIVGAVGRVEMTEADREAFALIAPFRKGGAVEPIHAGRSWLPARANVIAV